MDAAQQREWPLFPLSTLSLDGDGPSSAMVDLDRFRCHEDGLTELSAAVIVAHSDGEPGVLLLSPGPDSSSGDSSASSSDFSESVPRRAARGGGLPAFRHRAPGVECGEEVLRAGLARDLIRACGAFPPSVQPQQVREIRELFRSLGEFQEAAKSRFLHLGALSARGVGRFTSGQGEVAQQLAADGDEDETLSLERISDDEEEGSDAPSPAADFTGVSGLAGPKVAPGAVSTCVERGVPASPAPPPAPAPAPAPIFPGQIQPVIGARLAVWWVAEEGYPVLPFLPDHVTRPRAIVNLFPVMLPPFSRLAHPGAHFVALAAMGGGGAAYEALLPQILAHGYRFVALEEHRVL